MLAQGRADMARALLEGRARDDDKDKVQTLATRPINTRGTSGIRVFGGCRQKQMQARFRQGAAGDKLRLSDDS
jgi:hypothetical protein